MAFPVAFKLNSKSSLDNDKDVIEQVTITYSYRIMRTLTVGSTV